MEEAPTQVLGAVTTTVALGASPMKTLLAGRVENVTAAEEAGKVTAAEAPDTVRTAKERVKCQF